MHLYIFSVYPDDENQNNITCIHSKFKKNKNIFCQKFNKNELEETENNKKYVDSMFKSRKNIISMVTCFLHMDIHKPFKYLTLNVRSLNVSQKRSHF